MTSCSRNLPASDIYLSSIKLTEPWEINHFWWYFNQERWWFIFHSYVSLHGSSMIPSAPIVPSQVNFLPQSPLWGWWRKDSKVHRDEACNVGNDPCHPQFLAEIGEWCLLKSLGVLVVVGCVLWSFGLGNNPWMILRTLFQPFYRGLRFYIL